MLTNISKEIASWLVKSGMIQEDEYELYFFASYSLLFTNIPILFFIIISLLMGYGSYSLMLVCSVLAMRRYTGGYHARKPIVCIFFSLSSLFLGIILVEIIDFSPLLFLGLIMAAGVIWCFSPIDSENYRLTDLKKRKYRKRAHITLIIEILLFFALLFFRHPKYAVCIAVGIIISAVFLAVCFPKTICANE